MSLITCIVCARDYSDKMGFCPYCGFRPTLYKCPECGHFCSKDDKVCGYCGYPLSADVIEQASLKEIEQLYNSSVESLQSDDKSIDYKTLEHQFVLLGEYKDSTEKASECRTRYESENKSIEAGSSKPGVQKNKGISKKAVGIIIAIILGIVLIGVVVRANTASSYKLYDDEYSYEDDSDGYDDSYDDSYDDYDDYDDSYDDSDDYDDSESTFEAPKDELLVETDEKQIYYVYCVDGYMTFEGTYEGDGNFIVEISNNNQELEEIVCNEIGTYVLDRTVYIGTGYHYLEIFSTEGAWNLTWYGTGGG